MKALELANKLEYAMESHDGSSLSALCQGIADDAAAELRRLAEVNAELVVALQLAAEHLQLLYPGGVKANDFLCTTVTSALAKAKEQQ